ncbi:MAG TPA: PepSY domain-containing protein [Nocardioides sp.]|nr:PepSY domain-containing protein [Nocardioides sp.]
MKISALRRKRVVIPALATVAVLATGGTLWAASADEVTGDERDRVAAAAVAAVGGGRAVDVERSDDGDEDADEEAGEAYEVEVRLEDGREVDVTLDRDLAVLEREGEDDDDEQDDDRDDDRALTDAERSDAEQAALVAVGGGTVVDVDPSDDPGVAYEAEVRDAKGVEWEVDLDADFAVVGKAVDR